MHLPSSDTSLIRCDYAETNLGIFFQLSSELLAVLNGDGVFQALNQAWQDRLDISPQLLIEQSWLTLIHPSDRSHSAEALQNLYDRHTRKLNATGIKSQSSPLTTTTIQNYCTYRGGCYQHWSWQLSMSGHTSVIYAIVQPLSATRTLANPWANQVPDPVQHITDYAIYRVDLEGTILSWNQGAAEIYGYQRDEILGQSLAGLYVPMKDAPNPDKSLHLAALTGRFEIQDYQLRKDGSTFWAQVIINPMRDEQQILRGFTIVTRDVTGQKQTEEKLRYEAFHDVLTGLPNSALFKEQIDRVFRVSQWHENYWFAVLFLDLDRFKLINDSFGHQFGDRFLVEIAKRLQTCLRNIDIIARLGGDEFAILLEDLSSPNNAIEVARRIQQELLKPIHLDSHEVCINASIGIALNTLPRDCAEDFLSDADTAMYRAKAAGRGCYEIFDETMHTQAMEMLQLEQDLNHALENNELRIYYQPIISLRTGKTESFEALLRWEHPTQGLLLPKSFIAVAEDTGLIIPIGYWVLKQACQQLRHWQQQFPHNPNFGVSINLSAKQFVHGDLIPQINHVLQETGLNPHSLKLEITESAILDSAELTTSILFQIHRMGIRLSIDDFGTGYSSLSYLHRYPIDHLKIDRSFIDSIDSEGDKLELVRTIINLSWNLGLEVVAEGVETPKQLAQLRALQCEAVQGFIFSPPLTVEAATHWLTQAKNDPKT